MRLDTKGYVEKKTSSTRYVTNWRNWWLVIWK